MPNGVSSLHTDITCGSDVESSVAPSLVPGAAKRGEKRAPGNEAMLLPGKEALSSLWLTGIEESHIKHSKL